MGRAGRGARPRDVYVQCEKHCESVAVNIWEAKKLAVAATSRTALGRGIVGGGAPLRTAQRVHAAHKA